jgi:hypothetical protein
LVTINPDTTGNVSSDLNKTLSYALFHCNPLKEPPFDLELGFTDRSVGQIINCAHIPDALEKLAEYCNREHISKSPSFTLLYPIYLEAMGTDEEDTMHNIAWLIKEPADKNGWNFGRIGGYTGKTAADFISN